MSETAKIAVNGEALVASPLGALYWPARRALIVADLHFEKGSSFARRGVMLPPYDTRTTLHRLLALCRLFDPALVISLGDAFHDRGAEARIEAEDADLLAALIAARRWIWVLGNHDPAPPKRFSGEVCTERRLGRLVFRHEPAAGGAEGELAGHLHPCARVLTETRTQRRRCFASDGARLVLPAFGAYTGGLNVLDEAYRGLFSELTAWAIGGQGVYPISSRLLVADPPDRRRATG